MVSLAEKMAANMFVDNAKGYIRLNLAMPRATIRTGLERMAEAIIKHNGK